jgi:acetolactate synthase-1/2/3 large subunit
MATTGSIVAAQGEEPEFQPEMGDLLVAYLEQLGIEYVFGIPGGAIEPLYNALARSARRGGPRAVVARHETDAAFMADGYARNSGKLGVCCATTGPGTTNLITGVSSAFENHVPMLVITAQTALASFGSGAFQESSCTGVNTVGMFQYCTRYNTLVSHPEQLERKLATAIMTAMRSPSGPVHLSVPLDVLRSPAPTDRSSYDLATLLHRPSLTDQYAVQKLSRELASASKVVFVVGGGCSDAMGTIMEAAFLLDAKVVTTPHGKGLVSPYHPLYRGVIGFSGHTSASEALLDPAVEVVVAIGTTLGELATNGWDAHAVLNNRLIHIDTVEENFTRSPMARLHVRGRISTIFDKVVAYLLSIQAQDGEHRKAEQQEEIAAAAIDLKKKPRRHFELDEEDKYRDDSMPIKPQRLMRELTRIFPSNTRYLADTGNSFAWAIHYLHPFDRRVAERRTTKRNEGGDALDYSRSGRRSTRGATFWACLDYASMGWAIGAAVGTALACPGHPVVCLTGDGSFLMTGQELTVALQERLPVIFVVLNDSAYGMVKHGQRMAGAERIGFELPEVDFSMLARAMGVESYTIHSPQDLLELDIEHICNKAGPTLLDVRVDPEEAPPMTIRMKTLSTVKE